MVNRVGSWVCWMCLASAGTLAAQTLKLEAVGIIPGPADLVRVNGHYAYVAAGRTLTVVDIRDPSTPKARGSFTLPEVIYGITLSGSMAYVANGLPGLAILDLSSPDAPRLLGSLKTPGEALRVALAGTRAVVANRMSGLEIIDVANPAKPVSLGSFYTEGYARDVAAAGPLAYVVDSSTDFSVVDVSKPGAPTGLSTQTSALPPLLIAIGRTETSQNAKTAYVIGGGVLQVYDVSDPSAPSKISTSKIPDRTQAVAIEGSLAYVAAGAEGLQIIDLSNPGRPVITGSHKTVGAARDVVVSDSLILVAVAESKPASPAGVLILRKSP